MSLVPFAFVVPAMVIIAIVVFSFFGSHYQQYYDNYHTVHFPIMLALSVIPILGVTGYFVSDTLFKVISVFCCLVSVIFVLGLFASMLGFVFGIVDVVAGALALVVTLLIVGGSFKGLHTFALFCNFFVYFQVFCTGGLLLEFFKKGFHISH